MFEYFFEADRDIINYEKKMIHIFKLVLKWWLRRSIIEENGELKGTYVVCFKL